MSDQRAKILSILLSWAVVWPMITLLLFTTEGLMGSWPLPIRTLAITAIMVPAISFLVAPQIEEPSKLPAQEN